MILYFNFFRDHLLRTWEKLLKISYCDNLVCSLLYTQRKAKVVMTVGFSMKYPSLFSPSLTGFDAGFHKLLQPGQ